MGGRGARGTKRRSGHSGACENLYRLIRLRLGDDVSDREIARRWGMEWKSFVALKHGRRQVPRIADLEALAQVLAIEPIFVFQAAQGVAADDLAALLGRERRLRTALEHLRDAVFTVDAAGRIQDSSRRFQDHFATGGRAPIGMRIIDLVAPASAPQLLAALAGAAQDGSASAEVSVARGDGERLLAIELVAISGPEGPALGVQAIARDVTEERLLLRQLDAERRLLRLLHDAVPAACLLVDREGTIRAANPAAERVCPGAADEIVGESLIAVFGDPGPLGCPVTRSFVTGAVEQQVSRMRNRAGREVYVHRTAGPVVEGGRIEQVIEVIVDVTAQVERGDPRVLGLWRDLAPSSSAAPAHHERRSAPRAPTAFTASYSGGEISGRGRVSNLAIGGLFLELAEGAGAEDGRAAPPPRLAPGQPVDLRWRLPGDALEVKARAVVTWCREAADGEPPGLGLRFVEIAPPFAPITRSRSARGARAGG